MVAFWHLRGLAIGNRLAIGRAQNEKTVGYAFCVADTDFVGSERCCRKHTDEEKQEPYWSTANRPFKHRKRNHYPR